MVKLMNETLAHQLSVRLPGCDQELLSQAVMAVVDTITPWLEAAALRAFCDAVGDIDPVRAPRATELGALTDKVADRLGVSPTTGREVTQAIFAALGRTLDDRGRSLVRQQLPPQFGELLDDPHAVAIDRRHAPAPPDPRGLASARPGAGSALDTDASVAHSSSIARSEDPHGDRKLSGTDGAMRAGRTLSTSRRRR